jgi:hypothetical protein
MIVYQNSKGVKKTAEITHHAVEQLKVRYLRLLCYYGEKWAKNYNAFIFSDKIRALISTSPREALLCIYNNGAKRILLNDLDGRQYKKMCRRENKYGQTIRFRHVPFDLIIQDGLLKTVEICVNELRFLNTKSINMVIKPVSAAQKRLNSLDKKMRTYPWIESEIIYEQRGNEGTTYHQCECGRSSCRATYCVQCWQEMLELVK